MKPPVPDIFVMTGSFIRLKISRWKLQYAARPQAACASSLNPKP